MHKDVSGTIDLITGIKAGLGATTPNCTVIVCPPFTSLETASTLLKNSPIKLGAQNMNPESSGAFTGEISPSMLKSVGAEYVILGHSERRTLFGESDQFINQKIKKALEAGLLPIFCIGETLQERESGVTFDILKRQVTQGLSGISEQELAKIIIAYEPVWAIGTGKTASPEQAQEVHAYIRGLAASLYSTAAAEKLIIQYGGSVKPDNAKELLSQKDIDGALVGGACLAAESFLGIINAC